MGDDRQISAESQHNFHFLPLFNSKTTKPIFTIFLQNVEELLCLLLRASAMRWYSPFRDYRKTYVSFVIPIHTDVCKDTKAETLARYSVR